MADARVTQTGIAISKLKETAINTPFTLQADFKTLGVQSLDFQLPTLELTQVGARVDGSTTHGYTYDVRAGYFSHPRVTLSDRFSLDVGRDFLLQALGGVQPTGVVASG